jgi:hypothetical protein
MPERRREQHHFQGSDRRRPTNSAVGGHPQAPAPISPDVRVVARRMRRPVAGPAC